jgi:transglutaminase-like putative cysteine protease
MRLSVKHSTSYHYDAPVDYGLQQVRLTPKEREGQKMLQWDIAIEGGHKELHFTDHHANRVDLISIDPGGEQLVIHITGEVETTDTAGVIGPHHGFMPLWMFERQTSLTTPGPRIGALVKALDHDFDNDIARAHALSALIVERVPYATGQTDAQTSAEQAVTDGSGVCQDHAHIFITAMRLLGHPARYISGYLMMNDRIEQDATHAWAEAWFDGIGWLGFDVSNGHSPDSRYIRVASGLDYTDASPVSGMRFGAAVESMAVQLQVQQ